MGSREGKENRVRSDNRTTARNWSDGSLWWPCLWDSPDRREDQFGSDRFGGSLTFCSPCRSFIKYAPHSVASRCCFFHFPFAICHLQLPFAFHGVINTAHEHTRKHVRLEQFKIHEIKCLYCSWVNHADRRQPMRKSRAA